jgi:hypothetical protein
MRRNTSAKVLLYHLEVNIVILSIRYIQISMGMVWSLRNSLLTPNGG